MKKFLLALGLFLAAFSAQAQLSLTGAGAPITGSVGSPMVTVVIGDTPSTSVPSNSATNYLGYSGGIFTGTISTRDVPTQIAGTIGNLKVNFPTAIVSGNWVITLMINGSVAGSPGNVSCQVDSTHASCADTTDTAAVSANDKIAWRFTPTSTPTAQTIIQISSTITSSTNGQGVIFSSNGAGGAVNPSNSAANYGTFGGATLWNATEASASGLFSTGGTIDGLTLFAATAPGVGVGSVFTVFHNGSRTSITCSLSGSGSGLGITTCNDLSGGGHGFAVSANDTISLESCPGTIVAGSCTAAGTPATATIKYSVGWVPTIPGEAVVFQTFPGSLSTSAARYVAMNDGVISITATESNALQIVPVASTIKKLYVKTDAALSGVQTRTNVNRFGTGGGQSNGSITCPLNSTNTTACNDTVNIYAASAGDLVNWAETPTNTPPATAYYKLGAVITSP